MEQPSVVETRVCIDANDPDLLARFWMGLFRPHAPGRRPRRRLGTSARPPG
ncbi:MAG: hypothetical protein ACRDY7_02885 [Acidimicrobiia bacterium]